MNIQDSIPADFSGCVLVTKNGSTLFEGSFGYADLPNKIQNKSGTRFATASAGKAFVAVGILQLIESGRLRLDSTIGELLDLDLKAIDRSITVEQLLTHTSGIPDYFDESTMDEYDELWRDYPNYKIRSSSDLLPLFIDKEMMYPAGSRFQYNNTGFVVLGLIIEKLTGMVFDEYLQKNVFEPCGMADTGYYELDRLPERCANSYIRDEKRGGYYTNIYSVDAKGTGAGGAFTTVGDVQRFWDKLLSWSLLSTAMTKAMLIPHAGGDGAGYGYGIWLDRAADGSFTPHFEGCDPGVSFISSYDTVSKLCITAVSNFGCNVWELRRKILKLQGN